MNEIQVGFWFKAKKNLINPFYRIEEGKNEPNDENKVAIKDLLGENILKIGKVPGSYQLKVIEKDFSLNNNSSKEYKIDRSISKERRKYEDVANFDK